MDDRTGRIYHSAEDIEAARQRGEKLVELFGMASQYRVEEYYKRVADTRRQLAVGKRTMSKATRRAP